MTTSLSTFQVQCPSCGTEFDIDPERVPPQGLQAVCSHCMRAFGVTLPDDLATMVDSLIESLGRAPARPAQPEAPPFEPEPADDGDVFGRTAVAPEAPPQPEAPPEPEAVAEVAVPDEPEAPPEPETVSEVAVPDEQEAPPEPEAVAEVTVPDEQEAPPEPETHDLRSLAEEALAEIEEGDEEEGPERDAAVASGFSRFGNRDPQARAKRLARVLVSDIIAYYPKKHEEAVARGTVKEEFEEEVEKSWKEYVDQVGVEIAESTDYFREALNQVLARGREIF